MKNIEIEGIVSEIIFYNEENSYCVFEIENEISQTLFDEKEVVCVGQIADIKEGEYLKITGHYTMHPTYGPQLQVDSYESYIPTTVKGIEKYLASGIIKGVGEKTAKLIVNEFKEDTFNVIENEPEKLSSIRGISLKKAMLIAEAFSSQAQLRQTTLFLQNYGISPAYCVKIYKTFKDNTINVVKTNPYALANEVFGIGFKKADDIARKVGIDKNSPNRISAGIKYALNQALLNGNVYLPQSILKEETERLLEIHSEIIENCILKLHMENVIHIEKNQENQEDNRVYLSSYFYAENYVAKKLVELSCAGIEKIEPKVKPEVENLCEEQEIAVKTALEKGVLVITGGPGTGKTTTIKTIIEIMEYSYKTVVLAAPTGRAAKRMSEATGKEAKTIHRLLGATYNKEGNGARQYFEMCEDNPIDADVIIIDEMSMVDIMLMQYLLKAISIGTRLVLVGDSDQLPSVGAGNVLKDIISSKKIDTVVLNKIFRQAQVSDIIINAHNINKGNYPVLNREGTDFFLVRCPNENITLNTLKKLVSTNLPKYINSADIKDIQVLAPMKKGILGVQNLNNALQNLLNPNDGFKQEKKSGDIIFREGDRVMQIKNNYDLPWKIYKDGKLKEEGIGVFNGDTGIITLINNSLDYIKVLFDDGRKVEYDFSVLNELELSYAITIHKSQGSEYRGVVIPLFTGPQVLLTRNLLYTAVTRAKELVVIIGREDMINKMVDNNKTVERYTNLTKRIENMYNLFS